MRDRRSAARVVGMTRLLLALLVVLLTVPAASASAKPRYEVDAAIFAVEDWDYVRGNAPDRCSAWTEADGEVRGRVHTKGEFLLARVGSGPAFGGISGSARGTLEIQRKISWRVHEVGITPDCTPCGPSSEYGPCGDAPPPDDVGKVGCAPKAALGRVRGELAAGSLVVSAAAPSAKILRDCPRPRPSGVPLGAPEARFTTEVFRGAGRIIGRLGPGRSHTFRRESKSGSGCGRKRRKRDEMLSCTKHRTVVVIRRLDH
jgi:hypothetical protein